MRSLYVIYIHNREIESGGPFICVLQKDRGLQWARAPIYASCSIFNEMQRFVYGEISGSHNGEYVFWGVLPRDVVKFD